MNLFADCRPQEFDRDDVMVYHELGHMVTWFSYGREIGAISFKRSREGRLSEAKAANVNPPSLACKQDAEQFAERILAGESAARRKLGNITRDQISTMEIEITPNTNILALVHVAHTKERAAQLIFEEYSKGKQDWCNSARFRLGGDIPPIKLEITAKTEIPALLLVGHKDDDTMRAIWVAYETAKPKCYERLLVRLGAKPRWYKWLRVRLNRAIAVIDTHWDAIENIAKELITRLPAQGRTEIFSKDELILLLEREMKKKAERQ
ncbi:MAG: hypothetical protein WCO56_00925 [Verrucomicrobiota bacterium]